MRRPDAFTIGVGLEIGVGCEHDDLRLRSQLFESRRGIETG
jgi:hypothetical protein